MKVKVNDLKRAMDLFVDRLESEGVYEVDIEEDFYWSIDQENLYDPYKEVESFSLGQLSSDWENVERMISGENQPIAYGLVWLSSVIKRIGEKVVK